MIMNFDDIKLEFEYFTECMNNADSAISMLVCDIRNFIDDCDKYYIENENFIDELILHLAFFEKYNQKLFYFVECLNIITLFREQQIKSNIRYIKDYRK